MDWANPLAPIVSGLDAVVLDRLYRVTGSQSAGEVHRRGGKGSPSGIRFALERLADQGLVTSRGIGNIRAYELNTAHLTYLAVQAVLDAYRPYELLRERIRDLVVEHFGDDARSVAIFGSVARREAGTSSDVDLLVVTAPGGRDDEDDEVELVSVLHHEVERWTGNQVQIVEVTREQLVTTLRAGDPFAASLRLEVDTVVGQDIRSFLNQAVHR